MPEKSRFTSVAFINEIGNHSYVMTVHTPASRSSLC